MVVREDLLLMAIEETCKALLGLNRTDLPMWRGEHVAIHILKEGFVKETELWISGLLITSRFLPTDSRVIEDQVRGPRILVLDALSALSHSEQAYVLGDLLELEERLSKGGAA